MTWRSTGCRANGLEGRSGWQSVGEGNGELGVIRLDREQVADTADRKMCVVLQRYLGKGALEAAPRCIPQA